MKDEFTEEGKKKNVSADATTIHLLLDKAHAFSCKHVTVIF